MKRLSLLLVMVFLAACSERFRDDTVSMSSIALFDPAQFEGLWYEVARFPTPFQKGCVNSQATYKVIAPGTLSVRNACTKDGALSVIEGQANVVGPGRLKVRLNGVPVAADYWVLWVDEGYRTAVIGVPSGRAGWILNRDPNIPADRLKAARDVLEFNGYDLRRLVALRQEGS